MQRALRSAQAECPSVYRRWAGPHHISGGNVVAMAFFTFRTTCPGLPRLVRAALHAAWTASAAGAISLAALFTIGNLAWGFHAAGHPGMPELLAIIAGGASMLVLAFIGSFLVTVTASAVLAACAYPFVRTLRASNPRAFGAAGFCLGALVWLCMWWNGPPGNLYFGSWISVFAVGGLTGWAGGLAFGRHFPPRR